jgi:hypothetical protein
MIRSHSVEGQVSRIAERYLFSNVLSDKKTLKKTIAEQLCQIFVVMFNQSNHSSKTIIEQKRITIKKFPSSRPN